MPEVSFLKRYEQMVNVSEVHMSMVDRSYTYRAVNDAYLNDTGKKREEIVGYTVAEYLGRETFNSFVKEKLDLCFTGEKVEFEEWFTFPRTGKVFMQVTYYPVVNDDGYVSAIVVHASEHTKRKNLEEQIRKAKHLDALGKLAGGIAHDFNNQLACIMGLAERLSSVLESDENLIYVKKILDTCNRSVGLTKQLLAYAHKGKYTSSATDLHELISDVASILRHSIDKNIRVIQKLDATSFVVSGDPSQLHNALLNLAINARDAMPRGGTLTFATNNTVSETQKSNEEPAQEFLLVNVTDTGQGMTPETQRHIFEPFFTTKSEKGGTGMGLAAVQGTITSHGGQITTRSRLGEGSVFTLKLPVIHDQTEAFDLSGSQILFVKDNPHDNASLSRGHILIIDDEELLCEVMKDALEEQNYSVSLIKDAHEAAIFFKANAAKIDLVIMDMVMPSYNGKELYNILKKHDPSVKVVLCSGYSDADEVTQMLNNGVKKFLEKPFTLNALSDAVEHLINPRSE